MSIDDRIRHLVNESDLTKQIKALAEAVQTLSDRLNRLEQPTRSRTKKPEEL